MSKEAKQNTTYVSPSKVFTSSSYGRKVKYVVRCTHRLKHDTQKEIVVCESCGKVWQ